MRAHAASAVREVPGPSGRLPVQHAGRGAEPVPEAGHQGHPQGWRLQVQEERVASQWHPIHYYSPRCFINHQQEQGELVVRFLSFLCLLPAV